MAGFNLNKVIVGGRITDVPVLQREDGRDPVTHFDIAVTRRTGGRNGQDDVIDYLRVVVWGKIAEYICENYNEGAEICVIGNIRARSYNKSGERRFSTEIMADEAFYVNQEQDIKGIIKDLVV